MKGSALELAEAEGFGPSPSQLSTSNSCSSGLYTADPKTAWIYIFSVSLAPGNAQITPLSDTGCIFYYANDVSSYQLYLLGASCLLPSCQGCLWHFSQPIETRMNCGALVEVLGRKMKHL